MVTFVTVCNYVRILLFLNSVFKRLEQSFCCCFKLQVLATALDLHYEQYESVNDFQFNN